MPQQPGYTGLITKGGFGGFTDFCRVNGSFCYPIPDKLSSADAAPLMCAGVTVYAPLRRWLKPGMKCAVVGIGGLGHLALQYAHHMGAASVTAVGRTAAKAAEARSLGADEYLLWDDYVKLCGEFDIIVNCAPGDISTGALRRRGGARGGAGGGAESHRLRNHSVCGR